MLPEATPTREEITLWLAGRGHPVEWATYLVGLPWDIIKPGVQIAGASNVHPALALGAAALHTGDQRIRDTIQAHLAQHAPPGTHPDPTTPNRAARRAADRRRRRAR